MMVQERHLVFITNCMMYENTRCTVFACLNCDEMRQGLIYVVTDVKVNSGSNEVMVKGTFKHSKKPVTQYVDKEGWHSIDLAYTYVRTASDIFTNLSHLVGCP